MKKIIIIIVALSVLSILSVATFAMISDFEGAKTEPNVEENIEVITPTKKVLSFRKYRESITDFKLSEESLAQLSADFDKIIAENEMIEFEYNGFVREFMVIQGDHTQYKFESRDGKISDFAVSTKKDSDMLKYMMFLSCLTTGENDSVALVDYDYDFLTYNRLPMYLLFVSNDYKELGYENAFEYLKAINNGDAVMSDNSYYVDYFSPRIYKCTDPERTNLW